MGLTHFPHGILATPNIGGDGGGYNRLMQLWESDNIWYVDGNEGSASNAGNEPSKSVALISTAIAKASAGGTIYVKPKSNDTTAAQTYYIDTLVVPITKSNLSIIGAGNPGSNSGVQVKPSDVATHLVEVKAPGLTLDNMRLTLNGGTADLKMSIVHAVNETGVKTPAGLNIRNCRFEGDKSHPSITSSTDMCAALALGTCNYTTIENNTFYNCLGSIVAQLSTAAYHNLVIRNNIFSGAAANRAVDVWISHGQPGNIQILNNIFADALGTHSYGGTNYFLEITGDGFGTVAWNAFATASASFKAAGTSAIWPATIFSCGNTYSAANAGTTTSGMFGTTA
jgi:hypothetical protein